jgi:hypothetical protein
LQKRIIVYEKEKYAVRKLEEGDIKRKYAIYKIFTKGRIEI